MCTFPSLPLNENEWVTETQRDDVFCRLKLRSENKRCIDCTNSNPSWVSITYGVFLCLSCSGLHRRMGTHISFVRSSELDQFTFKQLVRMELGGNGRLLRFLQSHGLNAIDYKSKIALAYKEELDKHVQQKLSDSNFFVISRPSHSEQTSQLEQKPSVFSPNNFNTEQIVKPVKKNEASIISQSTSHSAKNLCNPSNSENKTAIESEERRNHSRSKQIYKLPLHSTPSSIVDSVAMRLDDSFDFDALEHQANQATERTARNTDLDEASSLNILENTAVPSTSESYAFQSGYQTRFSHFSDAKSISSADFFSSQPLLPNTIPRDNIPERGFFGHSMRSPKAKFKSNHCEDQYHNDPSCYNLKSDDCSSGNALSKQTYGKVHSLTSGVYETMSKVRHWVCNLLTEN